MSQCWPKKIFFIQIPWNKDELENVSNMHQHTMHAQHGVIHTVINNAAPKKKNHAKKWQGCDIWDH